MYTFITDFNPRFHFLSEKRILFKIFLKLVHSTQIFKLVQSSSNAKLRDFIPLESDTTKPLLTPNSYFTSLSVQMFLNDGPFFLVVFNLCFALFGVSVLFIFYSNYAYSSNKKLIRSHLG